MPHFPAPDETSLFYRDWGAGRPVVFVHGMLMSSDMWQHQMLHLTENGFRAVAYDRRGHGRVPAGRGGRYGHQHASRLHHRTQQDHAASAGTARRSRCVCAAGDLRAALG